MRTLVCIVPSLGGGGAELHMVRIVNELQAQGLYKVIILVLKRDGQYESRCHPGVEIQLVHSPIGFSDTGKALSSFYGIRKALRVIYPDLVWSILPHMNVAAILASSRGLQTRPRLVISEQTPPIARLRDSPSLIKSGVHRLMRRYYPRADRIIALSTGVAEEVKRLSPRASSKVVVIPNAGVVKADNLVNDVGERAARYPGRQRDDDFRVVGVGRLHPIKGFDVLIRAIAIAREAVDVTLTLVGDGPARSELERLVSQLVLDRHVTFTGFVDDPQKIVANSEMFVLSSRAEGFGNVIVEAMAAGLPVIATDCPYGPREILDDGRYGILVSPEDPQALGEAIIELIRDRKKYAELARASMRRWQRYTAENVAMEYHQLFQDVLNCKGRITHV